MLGFRAHRVSCEYALEEKLHFREPRVSLNSPLPSLKDGLLGEATGAQLSGPTLLLGDDLVGVSGFCSCVACQSLYYNLP